MAIIGIICALFALESFPESVRIYPVEPPHPAYRWIGEQEGDFTIMEFPTGPRTYASFIRQTYGSIYHWKKLIVGYSGFQSEENRLNVYELNKTFPDDDCMERLEKLNVRYVIVIPDILDTERTKRLALQERLHHEQSLGGVDIYRLIREKTE